MKIKFLQSASVIVEHQDLRILCDPWLVDGEYYGSWAHYPHYDFNPADFDDVDYIYLSHVHPDHCSSKTLSKLNKKIPVLILDFHAKFLKNIIERLGFEVHELQHDKRTHLKDNLHINIIAADNCDPQICGRYFGCTFAGAKFGATQMDSMCAIDNGEETILNINDCPFELAQNSASRIKNSYKNIDMLLVGYSGALAFPQCFELSQKEMEAAMKKIKQRYFDQAVNYIELLKPRYFMPFAGRYTLTGKLSNLNSLRGIPELEEGYDYLVSKFDQDKHKGIILNQNRHFDISTGKSEMPYNRTDINEKNEYVNNVLSSYKFDYENEPMPTVEELMMLIQKAYERFETKRMELQYSSDFTILLDLSKDIVIAISCDGKAYQKVSKKEAENLEKFVRFSVDPRLLKWILEGPSKAHWNNAEIGSHIKFRRAPNVYDRALHYCFNYFYS